ncbi:MAG TPA: NepR family anti-sigma factor [Microvirga sp.]|jgi:hypothetical protein
MPDTPHRDGPRPLLIGGDWSTGLNAPTSLNQAQILGALGRQLRSTYQDLLNEPVPAHLTAFVHRLSERDDGKD